MSILYRSLKLRHVVQISRCISTTSANSYWYKDYLPGPYPKTKEERDAAAKKYNLLPEEYEPYPDNGLGYGDYPKLPDKVLEARDPYYPWNYSEPNQQRNYGEPLHAVDLGYAEHPPPYSYTFMYAVFLSVIGFFFGLHYLSQKYYIVRPVAAKQFPKDGEVHYTFKPRE